MERELFSLGGKVAVVTGASRGIGGALASALAHAGAAVALLGRDAQTLAATEAALAAQGCTVMHAAADVSDNSSIDAAFDTVLRSLSRIDILINNAGVEQPCASLDVSEALWDRIVDTNLKGAFFCAQAAARRMTDGGSILNVCSLTSEVGIAGARLRCVEIRSRRPDPNPRHRVGRQGHPREWHRAGLLSNRTH
jgi:gluconate 5-dehydrogenase